MLTSLFHRELNQGIPLEDLALLTQVGCILLKIIKNEQSQVPKPSVFNSTGCLLGKLGLSMETLSSDRFYPMLLSLKTYLPSQLKAK